MYTSLVTAKTTANLSDLQGNVNMLNKYILLLYYIIIQLSLLTCISNWRLKTINIWTSDKVSLQVPEMYSLNFITILQFNFKDTSIHFLSFSFNVDYNWAKSWRFYTFKNSWVVTVHLYSTTWVHFLSETWLSGLPGTAAWHIQHFLAGRPSPCSCGATSTSTPTSRRIPKG